MNLYESAALRTITGPAIRPGGLALTERAMAFCKLPRGAMVLDVGCGSGATTVYLRRSHGLPAVGLDISRMLLEEAHETGLPAFIQGRAEALPIGDARLAAIFCECTFSLLPDPESALAEWRRVLAPGGYLILSDLYARSGRLQPTAQLDGVHCCLDGAVGCKTLFDRMAAAGFKVLLFEDHTPLLKRLAAQLVWEHGSIEAFWTHVGGACAADREKFTGRPGYYLMVARKSQPAEPAGEAEQEKLNGKS
jgi:arsenite methyltransferase